MHHKYLGKKEEERKATFSFFENKSCEYYPCHRTEMSDFNCLFCFCPMYYTLCLGEPRYIEFSGKVIKDCSECDYPHRPENYETMIEYLSSVLRD